jgi:hypothetical protein
MSAIVLQMPYAIKSRRYIEKLVKLGLLEECDRHRIGAIERAVQLHRQIVVIHWSRRRFD